MRIDVGAHIDSGTVVVGVEDTDLDHRCLIGLVWNEGYDRLGLTSKCVRFSISRSKVKEGCGEGLLHERMARLLSVFEAHHRSSGVCESKLLKRLCRK